MVGTHPLRRAWKDSGGGGGLAFWRVELLVQKLGASPKTEKKTQADRSTRRRARTHPSLPGSHIKSEYALVVTSNGGFTQGMLERKGILSSVKSEGLVKLSGCRCSVTDTDGLSSIHRGFAYNPNDFVLFALVCTRWRSRCKARHLPRTGRQLPLCLYD